jgi:hypothetical protein
MKTLSDLAPKGRPITPIRGGADSKRPCSGRRRRTVGAPAVEGDPLDCLLKYVEVKGPAKCQEELTLLAYEYVRFESLQFNIGRVNTDANVTNYLIGVDGNGSLSVPGNALVAVERVEHR